MKKVLLGFLILCGALFAWIYISLEMHKYQWNQRMTVTVQTPAGEVSGSSVSRVVWNEHLMRARDGMGWSFGLTGEAVVVEVLPGRYLFALLRGAGTTEYMGSVAAASISGQKGRVIDKELFAEVAGGRKRAAGMIAVPDYQFPVMVTFDDNTDPTTVRRVDPASLSASFGSGVTLKSVTLEVTSDGVTEGQLEAELGWVLEAGKKRFDVAKTPDGRIPLSDFLSIDHWRE